MNLLTLIEGYHGSGKTSSLRNLGPDSVVLNVERKMLPFNNKKGLNDLWVEAKITVDAKGNEITEIYPFEVTMNYLKALKKRPAIKNIVIDSISELLTHLLAEARIKHKNFDVWNFYNSRIFEFFTLLKSMEGKFVFVLGHIEVLQNADGDMIQRGKVKGKEWEGSLEGTATCVLAAIARQKLEGNGVEHVFMTNTDAVLPAKTPMEMFPQQYIDNDLQAVIDRYKEFYNLDENYQRKQMNLDESNQDQAA